MISSECFKHDYGISIDVTASLPLAFLLEGLTNDRGKPVNVLSLGKVSLHGHRIVWALLLRAAQMKEY